MTPDLTNRERLPQEGAAEGNLTLLVLVNGAGGEDRKLVRTAVTSALEHFGLPYRVRDLAEGELSAEEAHNHPAVVLAQQGLPLGQGTATALVQAHRAGVGLVAMAPPTTDWPEDLCTVMGFKPDGTGMATLSLQAADNTHWITVLKRAGDAFSFKRPVTLAGGAVGADRRVLLVGGGGRPAVVAGGAGPGRTVQMLFGPSVYTPEVLGHAECLDFVFWRSIAWAARKPLVAKRLPPMVTAYVGQAIGDGPDGLLHMDPSNPYGGDITELQRFAWAEIMNEFQFVPHVGLLTDCVPDAAGHRIRILATEGRAEFSAPAFTPSIPIHFANAGGAAEPLPEDEVADNLRRAQLQFIRWGLVPSRLLCPAEGQWSSSALAALHRQHIEVLMTPLLPDESASDSPQAWSRRPYGHAGYFIDTLPADEGIWLVGASPADTGCDFADGCTIATGSTANDLDAMTYRAAASIIRGLEAGFPGHMATRESNLAVLTKPQLRDLLKGIERLIRSHEPTFTGLSTATARLRDKVTTKITSAQLKDGQVALEMTGRCRGPVPLCIVTDDGPDVSYRWHTVDAFDGTTHVRP